MVNPRADDLIRVEVEDADARRAYRNLAKEGDKSFQAQSKGAHSLAKTMVASQLAATALSQAMGFVAGSIGDAARAAVEYEKTNVRLRAALKTQGLEVDHNADALNRQAAALEAIAGISDETIRSTQALALNMGVGAEDADKFVRAAIRLSNVTGRTLDGAMQQLVKTTGGLAGELGEAIPQIRGLTKDALRSGDAIDLINEMWADNLDLLNQGFSGQVNALGLAWGNVGEAMAVAANNSRTLNAVLGSLTTTLNSVAKVLESEGLAMGLSSLIDIAFFGGEATARIVEEHGAAAAAAGGPTSGVDTKGTRGARGTKGGGGGGGKRRPGKLRDLGTAQEGEIITIGGFPVDSSTGQIVAPAPPDPALIQEALDREREAQDAREAAAAAHEEALTGKKLEELAKREAAEKRFQQNAIQSASALGGALLGLGDAIAQGMAKTDKDRFEAKKIFGIADAALSGAMGVATTLGSYPYPFNLALAAAHAVAAATQVGVIASQGYEGGGGVSAPQVGAAGSAGGGQPFFGGAGGIGGNVGGGSGRLGFQQSGNSFDAQGTTTVAPTFVIMGALDESHGVIIQRALDKAKSKGVS